MAEQHHGAEIPCPCCEGGWEQLFPRGRLERMEKRRNRELGSVQTILGTQTLSGEGERLNTQKLSWLLCPNTSVNEVIVLFCLEKGFGEVCSIPRLHCKYYCEFYTHPFLLTLCRGQFLRQELVPVCRESSGLSLLLVQKT